MSSPGSSNFQGKKCNFKILIPRTAAGAIIGVKGKTLTEMQTTTGAKVKISKSEDFYPGTTERVCLISGTVESIIQMNEFIMNKVKEKPGSDVGPTYDYDRKKLVGRGNQVKILVPNSAASKIIGYQGYVIKRIKEKSGSFVQISQKPTDRVLPERCVTVIGEVDGNLIACRLILDLMMEDPPKDDYLNISYSNLTTEVANFSPTGSPYAESTKVSDDNTESLNSSSGLGDSFSLQAGACLSPDITFTNFTLPNSDVPSSVVVQTVEIMKNELRNQGFSVESILEICKSMYTLAKHGVFGFCLRQSVSLMNNIYTGTPNSAIAAELPTCAVTSPFEHSKRVDDPCMVVPEHTLIPMIDSDFQTASSHFQAAHIPFQSSPEVKRFNFRPPFGGGIGSCSSETEFASELSDLKYLPASSSGFNSHPFQQL